MSGIPETRKLWITPLSPVHMGTDEDYTPTGYVIEGNALYEFDQSALENLPANQRQALDKILSGKATPNMLKQVQAFFHKNREWLIPAAINVVHVSDELAALYKARVGKAANIETGGKQVFNALEIERAAYNPLDRRLFLPGSGLKGAMRTALLDAVNRGNRAQSGERNRELQQRLFGYSDLHRDPMRLVQVGDCAWQGPEELNSAEILFAVNRKKRRVMKNGKEIDSQAEQRNLYQMLECATPFRFRAFQGRLNISDLAGFDDRGNKLPRLQFSFGEIATACNRFYRPIFERETDLLKKRGFLDSEWRETVESLLGDPAVKARLENNRAFLLRVGRHSGAESVTLDGVRSIRIMKGKGEKPAWKPETKTLWLATGSQQDKRYLRPFGWLLVEMTEPGEALPEWKSAEALMTRHSEKMQTWISAVRRYQRELADKVQAVREQAEKQAREQAEREAEAVREQAEKQAREQAEREAEAVRKKAEEEARLAQLSPLERELEEICEREKNNNPVVILFNLLREGHWENPADQRAVASRIKALWQAENKWNPDFAGSNRQKLKQSGRCKAVLQYLEKANHAE